jgi:hypothetical protein
MRIWRSLITVLALAVAVAFTPVPLQAASLIGPGSQPQVDNVVDQVAAKKKKSKKKSKKKAKSKKAGSCGTYMYYSKKAKKCVDARGKK